MTNKQPELSAEEDPQTGIVKTQENFSPVIVSDTVGAVFLGLISIILLAVVGNLLVCNRKLEDQLRELDHPLE